MMTDEAERLEKIGDRVEEILCRIDSAAKRSGRAATDVLLVAVSKYAEPSDGFIDGLLRAGVFDLAENRPQRLLEKVAVWNRSKFWREASSQEFLSARDRIGSAGDASLRWHFIGSLQRNKVRKILPYVSLIHSVDSWKLLETIERILAEEEAVALRSEGSDSFRKTLPCFPSKISVLLEAHISDDATKQGFALNEIAEVLPRAAELSHIKVRGLMGMSGLRATPDEARRQFESLRLTLEDCRRRYPEFTEVTELSMGMSGDFETAIEEGATIVRIGSSLYPAE